MNHVRFVSSFVVACAAALLIARPLSAAPAARLELCVFDPSGAAGDAFSVMRDYRAAALAWGVEFELKPYTDEKTASEDLKAGKCDAALLTGTRARSFNRFAGTLEAIGAVRSYEEMKTLMKLLGSPKAAERLDGPKYSIAAIFPMGAVYVYVRDRSWNSVPKLAGKRVATLDHDEAAIAMVDRAGAAMVPADVGTFAGMFNNGHVDAAYAPAAAFQPLELEKGLAKGGGIIEYPVAQLTFQVVLRSSDEIPPRFAERSRRFAADNAERTLRIVRQAERDIPSKYWIAIAPGTNEKNEELLRQVRIQLRDRGVLDGTMLTLLRRVRCKAEPGRAECAEKKE